jgi:TolA-binding protein
LDQPDSALAMYRVVIDKFPDDARSAEALWRTARLQDERRESQAIELYARLVQDHPDFAQLDAAIYRWAWLVGASGATAQSDELFARLKRDFPHSRFAADATLRLAERALAAQKYDDAKKLLVELIEPPASAAADAPANSSPSPEIRQHALYLTARVAAAAKQWADVDAPLVKLLEEASDGELATQAAYLRAEASYQQGRFDEAVQRLTELAARTKDHPQNWSAAAELRRAQALAQMKQWSEALDVAHGIEASFPSFAEQHEADYLIGRALAAGADFAGAREAYAKVIESPGGGKTQTAAMAQWMIGESYFHQENYAAALAEYAKVDRYSFPRWQSAALLQAGKCHELLGHWRLAVEAYDRLVKTYPASEFAEEAARRSTAIQHRAATEPTKLK